MTERKTIAAAAIRVETPEELANMEYTSSGCFEGRRQAHFIDRKGRRTKVFKGSKVSDVFDSEASDGRA